MKDDGDETAVSIFYFVPFGFNFYTHRRRDTAQCRAVDRDSLRKTKAHRRNCKLVEAQRAKSTKSDQFADILANSIVLEVASFNGQMIKLLSETDP